MDNLLVLQKAANISVNRGIFKPELFANLVYGLFTEVWQ